MHSRQVIRIRFGVCHLPGVIVSVGSIRVVVDEPGDLHLLAAVNKCFLPVAYDYLITGGCAESRCGRRHILHVKRLEGTRLRRCRGGRIDGGRGGRAVVRLNKSEPFVPALILEVPSPSALSVGTPSRLDLAHAADALY